MESVQSSVRACGRPRTDRTEQAFAIVDGGGACGQWRRTARGRGLVQEAHESLNATMSGGPFPLSKPVSLSDRLLVGQFGLSSRSLGKFSLVTPISTL